MTQPIRTVAFVDDDDMFRAAGMQTLALAGFDPRPFTGGAELLAAIDADYAGVVVSDVRMPGMDGLQLFRRLRALDPDIPVILITGHGDIPMAVAALKDGAWDFLSKPFSGEQIVAAVHRASEARRLVLENRRLRAVADADEGEPLIGQTPVMVRLRETIRQIAEADVDVLVEGETGTGKEMVALLLHRWGRRRGRPFVALNCGALPEAMAESELFGHRDGVVPGARLSRVGRIESAHGGTLFLDELDAMPPAIQVRLLRVLEEREVMPLGDDEARAVDLRVVAAIKDEPRRLIEHGLLRADLYYRLNVVQLRVPPLRERMDDVPLLFMHFLKEAALRRGGGVPALTDAVQRHLHQHDWPGNVRELRHFADRIALGLDAPADMLAPADTAPLPERTQRFEADAIRAALARTRGQVADTVAVLGIPRKTFYDKVARHGIDIDAYRAKGGDRRGGEG